jgi:glycosyltransferase involved in cell wall biosynthesis
MEPLAIRVPVVPPIIAPLASNTERPLWSVMIPSYNCTIYLRETLKSVLAQDMGEEHMQIEVVDDASTDADVAQVVALIGGGRVQYYRQPANVGSLRNFETCLNRSRGQLIHLLHGDDRVVAGFYAQMTQLSQQYPEAGAVFCHYASIDETGKRTYTPPLFAKRGVLKDWLIRTAKRQYIQYASIAVRREVYEKLGSFYGTNYGEDWEMWVRIARYYPVAYTPEVLAEYRGHADSISAEKARLGHVLPDLAQVITRIEQHLPEADRKRMGALARQRCAGLSLGTAYRIVQETGDWSAARSQITQVLAMSQHPSIYYAIAKIYVKLLLHKYAGRR